MERARAVTISRTMLNSSSMLRLVENQSAFDDSKNIYSDLNHSNIQGSKISEWTLASANLMIKICTFQNCTISVQLEILMLTSFI